MSAVDWPARLREAAASRTSATGYKNGNRVPKFVARRNRASATVEPEPAYARVYRDLADFCERHHVVPVDWHDVDLFGFGTARAFALDERNRYLWFPLHELIGPTGADHAELLELWREEHDDPDGWTVGLLGDLEVVNFGFAITVFGSASPWAEEFWRNTKPLFRAAMVHSGLGDQLSGPVGHEGTFTDWIRSDGPMPSAEVARHQAMRGPLGGLDGGGHR